MNTFTVTRYGFSASAADKIVWRDTTAATWTNSLSVGNVLTYTMKGMSKDNYFFGVRAVDKEGNKARPLIRVRFPAILRPAHLKLLHPELGSNRDCQ